MHIFSMDFYFTYKDDSFIREAFNLLSLEKIYIKHLTMPLTGVSSECIIINTTNIHITNYIQ